MANLDPSFILFILFLAGGAIGVMAMLSAQNRAVFVYAQLVLMVGIYVGFAIINLDATDFLRREELSILLTESIVALTFMLVGLAFLNSERREMLGVLILLHGAVDLAHLLLGAPYSPGWYAYGCVIYDGVVGVAAVWLLIKSPTKNNNNIL